MQALKCCMGPLSLPGFSSGTQTTSVCSGGLRVPEHAARTLKYMLAFMAGRTPRYSRSNLLTSKQDQSWEGTDDPHLRGCSSSEQMTSKCPFQLKQLCNPINVGSYLLIHILEQCSYLCIPFTIFLQKQCLFFCSAIVRDQECDHDECEHLLNWL